MYFRYNEKKGNESLHYIKAPREKKLNYLKLQVNSVYGDYRTVLDF